MRYIQKHHTCSGRQKRLYPPLRVWCFCIQEVEEELTRVRMQRFAEVEALPLVVEYSTQGEDTLFSSTVGLHVLLFFTGAKPALDGSSVMLVRRRGPTHDARRSYPNIN